MDDFYQLHLDIHPGLMERSILVQMYSMLPGTKEMQVAKLLASLTEKLKIWSKIGPMNSLPWYSVYFTLKSV